MKKGTIVIFGSSSISRESTSYKEGEDCGRMLGKLGFNVMSGGYGGIMEAVSKGASCTDAQIFGVTSESFTFRPEGANRYITQEIVAPNIIERIQVMIQHANSFVVMPGNVGTLNELFMILTLFKVGECTHKLYVWKDPFYNALKSLCKSGILDESVLNLIEWVSNVPELESLVSGQR
ncbi:LOG family protein [bacterium]|nr:LOG family protein [bacterium]